MEEKQQTFGTVTVFMLPQRLEILYHKVQHKLKSSTIQLLAILVQCNNNGTKKCRGDYKQMINFHLKYSTVLKRCNTCRHYSVACKLITTSTAQCHKIGRWRSCSHTVSHSVLLCGSVPSGKSYNKNACCPFNIYFKVS